MECRADTRGGGYLWFGQDLFGGYLDWEGSSKLKYDPSFSYCKTSLILLMVRLCNMPHNSRATGRTMPQMKSCYYDNCPVLLPIVGEWRMKEINLLLISVFSINHPVSLSNKSHRIIINSSGLVNNWEEMLNVREHKLRFWRLCVSV